MKKELKPFLTRKKETSKKKLNWIAQGPGFNHLIGKKCSYQNEEERDFECQIIGFEYVTEDKPPYDAHVLVKLLPFENPDADNVNAMLDGVSLASIYGIETE